MDWVIGIILFTFISVQLMKWLTPELYDACRSKLKIIKDNLMKQELAMPMGKGTYGSKRGRPPKKNKGKKKKK